MAALAGCTAIVVRVFIVVGVVLPATEGRGARHPCPAAAWRSPTSHSAFSCAVQRAAAANADPGRDLAPGGGGEGVAKRPLLADPDELLVKVAAAPRCCLRGGYGPVVGPGLRQIGVLSDPGLTSLWCYERNDWMLQACNRWHTML